MRFPGGLSVKVILVVAVLIVFTSVTLGWFFINHNVRMIVLGLVDRGASLARNLAYHLEYELQVATEQRLGELLDGVVSQEDVLYVVVHGDDNRIRAQAKSPQLGEIPPLSEPRVALAGLAASDPAIRTYKVTWGRDEIYEIVCPVKTRVGRAREEIGLTLGGADQTLGWARIGMSLSLKRVDESVTSVKSTVTFVTLSVIVVGVLVAVLLVRIIVGPVRALAAGAQRIEKGELDLKVPVVSRDEIGELGESFNRMAEALRARQEENARLFRALEETNQRLETTSRHKSQFLANMSHELRTPLNAIIGFSEILLSESHAELAPEERREFQDHILSSGRHLLRLINDILDLSKVEAGRMTLEPERLLVAEIIEGALGALRVMAAKKRIVVETSIDPVLGSLAADPGKLKQVLYNLLSNAIKFTPDGGHVTVIVAREPGEVRFAVRDTGIGIPVEEQERIFEEFHQVQQTAAKEYPGTGLGLSLARRLVELHGGRLWVESVPGQGSTFTFSIPVAPESEPAPRPAIAGEPTGPLVLVVEDDQRTLDLLRFSLSRAGYRVEEARDGDEALAKARASRPAIITLDILLPKRDGWDVLRELKQDPATRDIPVIIVSILDEKNRGFSLGAADYILKPFSREDLLRRLAHYGISGTRPSGSVKALIVVDDIELMDTVGGMLEDAGFHTLRAVGASEGLSMAVEARPDVILVNLLLQGMSGFELMQQLRGNEWTRDIPVFVVSARGLDEEDRRVLKTLATAVIERATFSPDGLLDEVSRLMRLRGAGGGTDGG